MGSWIPLQKPMSPDKVGLTWVEPSLHGIDFQNELSDAQAEKNRILENGSGVAAGDVNGDGRCDLYFATLQGPNRLYLNQGHWQFEEVPDAGGAACEDASSTGVLLVDVDGEQTSIAVADLQQCYPQSGPPLGDWRDLPPCPVLRGVYHSL